MTRLRALASLLLALALLGGASACSFLVDGERCELDEACLAGDACAGDGVCRRPLRLDSGSPPSDGGGGGPRPATDAGAPEDLDAPDGGSPPPGLDGGAVEPLDEGRAEGAMPWDDAGPSADGGPLDDGRDDGGAPSVSLDDGGLEDAGHDENGRPLASQP